MERVLSLSISTDCVQDWRTWEVLREICQNAKDAEEASNHEMTVKYDSETQSLVVRSAGAAINRTAWLTGYSTKRNNPKQRGQWGEGLKLACIAALQNRHQIEILTHNVLWLPYFGYSAEFEASALFVKEIEAVEPFDGIKVTISNVSKDQWEEAYSKLLFLSGMGEEFITTDKGTILLDAKMKGKIYSGGIFVREAPSFIYGYDFCHLELDRDRHLTDHYVLRYKAATLLWQATQSSPKFLGTLCRHIAALPEDMPLASNEDVLTAASHPPYRPEDRQVITNFFNEALGDAVVCKTEQEKTKARSFGATAVKLSHSCFSLLQELNYPKIFNCWILANRELEADPCNLDEINLEDFLNFCEVLGLIRQAISRLAAKGKIYNFPALSIVKFKMDQKQGRYLFIEEAASISIEILSNLPRILSCLVHEISHQFGDDGSLEHSTATEELMEEVLGILLEERSEENSQRD